MYQNLRSKTTQRKFSILIFFFPQSVCSPSLSSRAASVFTQEQSNPSQVRIVIKIVWLSYHCDNDWKLLYTKYNKHDIVISLWQWLKIAVHKVQQTWYCYITVTIDSKLLYTKYKKHDTVISLWQLIQKYKKHNTVISLWRLIQNWCTQSTKA